MDLPTRRERLERAVAAGRVDAKRELEQDDAAARAAAREELAEFETRLKRVEETVAGVGDMLRAVGATAAIAFALSHGEEISAEEAAAILGGPSPLAAPPEPETDDEEGDEIDDDEIELEAEPTGEDEPIEEPGAREGVLDFDPPAGDGIEIAGGEEGPGAILLPPPVPAPPDTDDTADDEGEDNDNEAIALDPDPDDAEDDDD